MTPIILTTPDELATLIQTAVGQALSQQAPQVSPTAQTQLFSIDEAAAFLGLARQTLYGFTSKRGIPFIKRGKKLYFSKADLEKWLLEGKQETLADSKAEQERGQS